MIPVEFPQESLLMIPPVFFLRVLSWILPEIPENNLPVNLARSPRVILQGIAPVFPPGIQPRVFPEIATRNSNKNSTSLFFINWTNNFSESFIRSISRGSIKFSGFYLGFEQEFFPECDQKLLQGFDQDFFRETNWNSSNNSTEEFREVFHQAF